MSKFPLVVAACVIIPAPALAQIVFVDTPLLPQPTKAEKSRSDLDKIQCRMQETTGTRLGRHQVCLTREQWLIYEAEEKNWMQQIQSRAAPTPGGG